MHPISAAHTPYTARIITPQFKGLTEEQRQTLDNTQKPPELPQYLADSTSSLLYQLEGATEDYQNFTVKNWWKGSGEKKQGYNGEGLELVPESIEGIALLGAIVAIFGVILVPIWGIDYLYKLYQANAHIKKLEKALIQKVKEFPLEAEEALKLLKDEKQYPHYTPSKKVFKALTNAKLLTTPFHKLTGQG